jgi:DNA end-binding protein Ku
MPRVTNPVPGTGAHMPRSIWNGTVTFGLVNVPIKLYTATESKTVHFHELHAKDEARIEHKRICPKEDKEIPYEEVVKGYEVAPDEYVVLSKEEVAAADPPRGKVIEIESFVPAGQIDPVFYDRTYYVGARGDKGQDAYRLLYEALRRSEKVGIGRFTFHNSEQLVALRALDGLLGLHKMRFHDELVSGSDLDIPEPQRKPAAREVEMAGSLVSSLESDFDPSRYEDTYRQAVLDLIERKARGEDVQPPQEDEPEQDGDDLMAALEASVKAGRR